LAFASHFWLSFYTFGLCLTYCASVERYAGDEFVLRVEGDKLAETLRSMTTVHKVDPPALPTVPVCFYCEARSTPEGSYLVHTFLVRW
jgi:hypothetical protein